jgi:S-adenosylmethionine:tRNA ribosyltransferase-isomerase
MEINIGDYFYELPQEKIAVFPVEPRDSSKLLVYKNGQISHENFLDLPESLPLKSKLFFNDTKVMPARIHFKRASGASIEIFLLNPVLPSSVISEVMEASSPVVWNCLIGNKKKWKKDESLELTLIHHNEPIKITAQWQDIENNYVSFDWQQAISFSEILDLIGQIPLPPYIHRPSKDSDKIDYQTIYSSKDGAVAAPTAGLHFSDSVFEKLKEKNIACHYLTLHVGAGTFLPVKTQNALEHPMHAEQMVFEKDIILELLDSEGPVIPVGTTSMRSLESLYWFGTKLFLNMGEEFEIDQFFPEKPKTSVSVYDAMNAILTYMDQKKIDTLIGSTSIMIFPGYEFKICKGIITNFHQPSSTLLLLIAALIGEKKWKPLYQNALENNYRFLSFGDSSLLIP